MHGKNGLMFMVSILAAMLSACSGGSSSGDSDTQFMGTRGDVRYRVTIATKWTSSSHPDGPAFPNNAHFSRPVMAVHSNAASFWRRGQTASNGTKDLAETGATGNFVSEIEAEIGSGALNRTLGEGSRLGAEDSQSIEITANDAHPLYTLATMIAPSPDWFIGLSGFSLKNSSNQWYRRFSCDLIGYDAGTESSPRFITAGTPTVPVEPIHRLADDAELRNDGKSLTQAFATITIELATTGIATTDATPTCPS